jgi:hypothetical protein
VANALPTLKSAADIVTAADHGAGVVELIEELLRDDLASREPQLKRHQILLGTDADGREVHIPPHGESLLVLGAESSQRSAFASTLMERVAAQRYTFCLIDVTGQYGRIGEAVSLGTATRPPTTNEAVKLLQSADKSGVINLAGLPVADQRPFLEQLMPGISELRARLGRPHWLVIDDTQRLLPAQASRKGGVTIRNSESLLHITARPAQVAREVLNSTTLVIALGTEGTTLLREFAEASGSAAPATKLTQLSAVAAVAWRPQIPGAEPFRINIAVPQQSNGLGGSATVVATAANLRAAKASRGSTS